MTHYIVRIYAISPLDVLIGSGPSVIKEERYRWRWLAKTTAAMLNLAPAIGCISVIFADVVAQ